MEIMIGLCGGFIIFYNRAVFSRYLVSKIYRNKGDETSKLTKEQRKEYDDTLMENFDIVSLSKSTNALKVLNLAHFEEHHLVLLPSVLKAIKRNELKDKKKDLQMTRSKTEFKKFGLSKSIATLRTLDGKQEKKAMNHQQAMDILFSKTEESGNDVGESEC